MKLLLVYPPFCTPSIMPYSLVNLYSFLRANSVSVDVLDMNIEFHKEMFSGYTDFFKSFNIENYEKIIKKYDEEAKDCYRVNNKAIVDGRLPELFDELLNKIKEKKPDIVGFSIVYSSQAFYAYALIKELKRSGIKVIVGGPGVNVLLKTEACFLRNEFELLKYIKNNKINNEDVIVDYSLDYNIFDINRYFNKEAVLPLKTSHGCYYARCAFCTHHKGERYFEYELNNIEKTIMDTKHKYFFIIDDMVSKGRIIEISKIMKKYNKDWVCQLRPTKDYDCDTLKKLKEAGCNMIIWGVESGCQRVLDIMGKGTNVDDVSKVLQDSHEAGIRNVVYIMFGFPGETEEEFIETVKFLEDNNEAIDLVSTSVFGLQRGSLVYDNPEKYGVYEIVEKPRTVLEPKISFKVKEGLSNDDILRLKQKYRKKIEAINKYPKSMNFFREHMLVL